MAAVPVHPDGTRGVGTRPQDASEASETGSRSLKVEVSHTVWSDRQDVGDVGIANNLHAGRVEMRWKKLNRGPIFKWTEVEQSLEGRWLGSREGNLGLLGSIETAQGVKVTFSLPAVLADHLLNVQEGSPIRVVYLGPTVSDAGRTYKRFDVFVGEEDADDDGEVGEPSGDERVPF